MTTERYHYIFTRRIRLRNGRFIYAEQYGLKAFRIRVRDDEGEK